MVRLDEFKIWERDGLVQRIRATYSGLSPHQPLVLQVLEVGCLVGTTIAVAATDEVGEVTFQTHPATFKPLLAHKAYALRLVIPPQGNYRLEILHTRPRLYTGWRYALWRLWPSNWFWWRRFMYQVTLAYD